MVKVDTVAFFKARGTLLKSVQPLSTKLKSMSFLKQGASHCNLHSKHCWTSRTGLSVALICIGARWPALPVDLVSVLLWALSTGAQPYEWPCMWITAGVYHCRVRTRCRTAISNLWIHFFCLAERRGELGICSCPLCKLNNLESTVSAVQISVWCVAASQHEKGHSWKLGRHVKSQKGYLLPYTVCINVNLVSCITWPIINLKHVQ